MNSFTPAFDLNKTNLTKHEMLDAIERYLAHSLSMTSLAMHTDFSEVNNVFIEGFFWFLHEIILNIKELHEVIY